MSTDPIADRIVKVFERASPRIRKILLEQTPQRKFPEGVVEPRLRLEQRYWVDWHEALEKQLTSGKLKLIGYAPPVTPKKPVKKLGRSPPSKKTSAIAYGGGKTNPTGGQP